MASTSESPFDPSNDPTDDDLLDANEAAEEIDKDPDHPMDEASDDEGDDENNQLDEEIQLQNDSLAHFDSHSDSIFCIAQHPADASIILTGGGDDIAYIWRATAPDTPVLPPSYESGGGAAERPSIAPLQKLDGHADSVNAVAFTRPTGEFAVTAGLDGRLRAYRAPAGASKPWTFVAETQEVQEINWVAPCPGTQPGQRNMLALGANDGSVWVYEVLPSELRIVQALYLHTESCTAGAWTPDGKLLATVSEDGSFYVWDIFETGQAVVSLTAADQRFAVEGGLYSVAVAPTGAIAAVGGAGGNIKIVGLPQTAIASGGRKGKGGAGAKEAASSAGQILGSLQAQSDGIETLSFAASPLTLLAAGSVDGSIALFDTAHRFAVRRHIREAHEEYAVVKVEFVQDSRQAGHVLTSAGMDGVVRRWDARGGTTAAGQGFMKEWKGHRGDGEGGGVLGFVQGGGGDLIVTAGDDGVSLLYRAEL